jgi:hypothetical protein
MANDPSMPPSEQASRVSVNASPAMSPEAEPSMPPPRAGGPPPGDGGVMINIPKGAFDAMHRIVISLAVGLTELKKTVDAQAGGGMPPEGMPMPPQAGPVPSGPSPEGVGDESEESFLKGLAEEGSKR